MFRFISKRQWILILILIITVIAGYFILPVSVPFIAALFTALMLNPIVRWLQKQISINRKLAVSIVFLLFLIVIGLIGTYFVTRAVTHIISFAENAPIYLNQLNSQFIEWESDFDQVTEDLPPELMVEVKDGFRENLIAMNENLKGLFELDKIAGAVAKIPEYLVSLIVYIIALFLFMLEMPKLKSQIYSHLTSETAEKVRFMNKRLSSVILGFLKAQFLVSLIIFAVTLAGLLFIVPEVALLMALIVWAIDFIPIIGSIVVLGPWAAYLFLTGDIVMATELSILAVFLLVIRRTVEPKVMGRHIGLSPLATLIAMYLGLQLIGIIGFILGPLLLIAFNSAKEAKIIKLNYKI